MPSQDADAIAAELSALEPIEADLDMEAPEGDAYETAIGLLSWQLHQLRPEHPPRSLESYANGLAGQVVAQWRQTLRPAPDKQVALRTRRVRRLLAGRDPGTVTDVLIDKTGRYTVLTDPGNGTTRFIAEWPYDLQHGWNERTIIAADPDSPGAVFALTTLPGGGLEVDPVPLDPRTGPSFGYGYQGGSPATLYRSLMRCALARTASGPRTINDSVSRDGRKTSQLWKAISATSGPLRLSWPAVCEWASADASTSAAGDQRP